MTFQNAHLADNCFQSVALYSFKFFDYVIIIGAQQYSKLKIQQTIG